MEIKEELKGLREARKSNGFLMVSIFESLILLFIF